MKIELDVRKIVAERREVEFPLLNLEIPELLNVNFLEDDAYYD